jgi:hypothetical protein
MWNLQRIVAALAAGMLGSAFFGTNAVDASAQSNAAGKSETVEARTITVRIDRPFATVFEFLTDPTHWKDGWIADSGGGTARVRFTPRNKFGVVDHTVIRPSGQRVYIPMRLIANGRGCELLFTLFREPKMSDTQFDSDAGFVQRDLNRLKSLMEK